MSVMHVVFCILSLQTVQYSQVGAIIVLDIEFTLCGVRMIIFLVAFC